MTGSGLEQYEQAEGKLFEHYGLETRTRRLAVREPALAVRALESGDGDPLVFVHGGGSSAAEWAPLLAELSDYRCLAVDRPGCGETDPFDYTGIDLRRHAVGFLDGVLDALELERASLVANSMGGLWSLWLALDRPQRVSSLALLGAPAMMLGTSAPLPLRLLGVRGLNRLLFRLQPPSVKQARSILKQVCGTKAVEAMPPEFFEAVYRGELVPGAETAWRTLLERVARIRGGRVSLDADELRRVQQPVLFIWGDGDAFAGPEYGREACGLMPDAKLEVLVGGHLPWVDEPRRCAELVSAFLRSHGEVPRMSEAEEAPSATRR